MLDQKLKDAFAPKSLDQLESLVDEDNAVLFTELLNERASSGDEEAAKKLFDLYFWGAGSMEQDEGRGLEILRLFAEKHHSGECARLLAEAYRYYVAGEHDEKVVHWYSKGAELLDGESCYELGEAYAFGWLGLVEDEGKAVDLLDKAARYGFTGAYRLLASLAAKGDDESGRQKAIQHLTTGAKLGDSNCQTELGNHYLAGRWIPREPKLALHWLTQAAQSGNTRALNALGDIHLHGEICKKDDFEAFANFEDAAKRHSKSAQTSLAALYLLGVGVERSQTMAYAWLRVAGLNRRSADSERISSFATTVLKCSVLTSDQRSHAERFVKAFIGESSLYKGLE